jgi:hypothetical protein
MEIIHEEWRPVQIDEGYEVSSCGKVRSTDRVLIRKNGMRLPLKGRPIAACLDSHGYPQVSRVEIVELCRSGEPQRKVGKRFGLSQTAVSHIIRKVRGQ